MARQTLGRGISALLGEEIPTVSEAPSLEIDIDLIEPNPEQPRTRFNDKELDELSQSIRENGVVQPIVVRRRGSRYQIVAGERRWRASQRAELRRIPAIVREVSDEQLLQLALIENIQRQELNPIEEGKAFRKLIDSTGLTQDEVARRVGKDRTVIATSMRLLKLPAEIQTQVEQGVLTAGHGRALLTTDDEKLQRAVAKMVVEYGWSVRETERAMKGRKPAASQRVTPGEPSIVPVDPNVKAAETRLMRRLSTGVKIIPGRRGAGGKIEIEYYSTDDLNRIYEAIVSK
jgi:ParB family transcriptional regulator, chromosome partitioning protein